MLEAFEQLIRGEELAQPNAWEIEAVPKPFFEPVLPHDLVFSGVYQCQDVFPNPAEKHPSARPHQMIIRRVHPEYTQLRQHHLLEVEFLSPFQADAAERSHRLTWNLNDDGSQMGTYQFDTEYENLIFTFALTTDIYSRRGVHWAPLVNTIATSSPPLLRQAVTDFPRSLDLAARFFTEHIYKPQSILNKITG